MLPPLKYDLGDLEPVISRETMDYHYNKHLKGYVDKLNQLIVGTEFEDADLETIVKRSQNSIYNNGAQMMNHIIYFNSLSPNPKTEPTGELKTAIEEEWGTFDNFKKEFTDAANALFGSGWVWLAKDESGNLCIFQAANAGNPLCKGYSPLFGLDVWEHAYYIDYRNNKAEHVNKIWSLIDWESIEQRY
ncbi:MAG: superoxide dismutase [Odoribacter sp.]|nr:superoxide dismutase [Odoribacter sp.]